MKQTVINMSRGSFDYYLWHLQQFIDYIRPQETNGGIQEEIDCLQEFVNRCKEIE